MQGKIQGSLKTYQFPSSKNKYLNRYKMNYFNHQWKNPFKIKQDKQGTGIERCLPRFSHLFEGGR